MTCTRKGALLNDLFFSLVGLDCNSIQIRKSESIDIHFNPEISRDHLQIINTVLSIIVGIKKCKYSIEDAYFSSGTIRKYLFKGVEEEVEIFMEKINTLRRDLKNIEIESLPFLLQEDIEMFNGLLKILKEIEGVSELFLLEAVLNTKINSLCILNNLVGSVNSVLICLIEGSPTNGYFEERHSYDYSECFWSSHYRIKDVPGYLQRSIKILTDLGKISKIRQTIDETQIKYTDSVILVEGNSIIINEASIIPYYKIVSDCPIVRKHWKEGITEVFGRIGLDVSKYAEIFKEFGPRMFKEPSKKDLCLLNYLMKKGSSGYSVFEEFVDSPSLSFLDDSTFLLESVEGVRTSPVSFVYSELSLSKTLLGIYDTKSTNKSAGLSLLQGLDISFSLKEPVSMFFSAKSLSELKILFRLIYSLYSVEYFLCSQYSNWRIRQILLGFVTGVRMFITEKMDYEFQKVINEEDITQHNRVLEEALSHITKASLLTNPFLIQFYSRLFFIAFSYIEITNREQLAPEDIDEIIHTLKKSFRTALPYVKSPFLILLFESLI